MQPIEQITAAWVDGYRPMTADEQGLAQTIYRLLAEGRPAAPATIAARADWDVGDVEGHLDDWPAVFRNDACDVVGFWGLSSEAVSEHRIDFHGIGTAWTWCSYDTLFITPLVGVTAQVTSRCPITGAQVDVTVSPDGVGDVQPPTATVSMLLPDRPFDDDVRATLCHYILFFASTDAADEWTSRHPGTFSLSVAGAFEIARRQNARVFGALVGAAH